MSGWRSSRCSTSPGIDVLAAAHEHVVGAAHESIGAGGIAAEHVARDIPAVGRHDLAGLFRKVQIAGHVGGRADPEDTFVRIEPLRVHRANLDVGQGPSEHHVAFWPAVGMRSEHDRPGFGRPVGVRNHGVRERALDGVDEFLRGRCRTHADIAHSGEIGIRKRIVLADRHRKHGGHRSQPGDAEASDRLYVLARIELRQKHHARMRREHELRCAERIHVEKAARRRSGDRCRRARRATGS